MKPLFDFDVLAYEVGFGVETAWDEPGYPPFDRAADMLDNKIANICALVNSTEPLTGYLTGKGNFRYDIAKRTPYKVRIGNKPFHYYNLKAYMQVKYEVVVSEGMEADDLIAIEQCKNPHNTISCSRDKDSFTFPGWKYSWECGNQAAIGPLFVEGFGKIELIQTKSGKKIKGYGDSFFYAQLLMGDDVDSIPGLGNKTGPVKAFRILEGSVDAKDALKRVYGAYRTFYGPLNAYREMLEQSRLLWMTRKLKRNGEPFLYGQTRDFTKTKEGMDIST